MNACTPPAGWDGQGDPAARSARRAEGQDVPLAVAAEEADFVASVLHDRALADLLAAVLTEEPGGLACDELRRRTRRRRLEVLKALTLDPRFTRLGSGRRGSRWALAAADAREATPDGMGRIDSGDLDSDPISTARNAQHGSDGFVRMAGGGGRPTVEPGAVMGIAAAPGATAAGGGRHG